MHYRRLVTVPALVLALLLAACASSGGEGAASGGPFPTVTGEFGERPTLSFPDSDPSSELETAVLHEGDGRALEPGELLLAHYVGQVWDGPIFDSSYDRGVTSPFPIGAGRTVEGFDAGLVGQRVGSRVLTTIPPDLGYGAEGNEAAGISGSDTIVFVVDLMESYGPQESGASDAAPTEEAASVGPVVDGAPGSPPSISVPPDLAEPTEVTTTVLARAEGQEVVPGRVVVQYAGTFWDNSDGESTWELGQPQLVTVGGGGSFDRLAGIPVGSRVLQQLPASETTPAIALVIDILGQSAIKE